MVRTIPPDPFVPVEVATSSKLSLVLSFPLLQFDQSSIASPRSRLSRFVSCRKAVSEADQVQTPLSTQGMPTQSWYPPSVVPPSLQSSPYGTFSRSEPTLLTADAKSAGIVSRLKDKSVDELKKLLAEKDAYKAFFNSLDEVRSQNHTHRVLRNKAVQLAEANLEKEPSIVELKNQCTIIRASELAYAQEKLAELLRLRDETINSYSRCSLLDKLHEAAYKADEESDSLQTKLLKEEVDMNTFVYVCFFGELRFTINLKKIKDGQQFESDAVSTCSNKV